MEGNLDNYEDTPERRGIITKFDELQAQAERLAGQFKTKGDFPHLEAGRAPGLERRAVRLQPEVSAGADVGTGRRRPQGGIDARTPAVASADLRASMK
jgi:hypothetical protein